MDAIDSKIKSLQESENPSHPNIIEGLSQLISTLDIFLNIFSQESESDDFYIKVYDAVHLESGKIQGQQEIFKVKSGSVMLR